MMEAVSEVEFWQLVQATIKKVCVNFDHQWQKRKRSIDSHFLVLFIFKLVLSPNKQGYASVLNELWDNQTAIESGASFPNTPYAASSICEARQKMPPTIFHDLNNALIQQHTQHYPSSTGYGHRVFGVDGSKLNLPHELHLQGYKIQSSTRHYPEGLLSTLYHLGDSMIYDCIMTPNLSEREALLAHMDLLQPGDVLVLDRGYFSYLILHECVTRGLHLVCRIQSGRINPAIDQFLASNDREKVIEYEPSTTVKFEIKKKGFELSKMSITVRLIKYVIDDESYICLTTLTSNTYPIEAFSTLYHGRWGIEELYKISKQLLGIESFHSKTERGVQQEIYAHAVIINIARMLESCAKNRLPEDNEKDNHNHDDSSSCQLKDSYWKNFSDDINKVKINFKNCLMTLGRYMEKLFFSPYAIMKIWVPNVLDSIARVKQKIRPGRHYPRRSFKPRNKWQRVKNE